jgi:hypothetical protein
MKKLTIGALLAGQLLGAAQPALAADLVAQEAPQMGAFAGARLRVPLGGAQRRQVRAGLTIAPTLQSRGETRGRIGDGLEFGYRSNRPLSFSLAGQDLNGRRFGAAQDNVDDHRGFPVKTVLLVIGGVLVVAAVATYVVADNILDNERSGPDGS